MPTRASDTPHVETPSVSYRHGTSRGRGAEELRAAKRVIEQLDRTPAEDWMLPVEPRNYAGTRE